MAVTYPVILAAIVIEAGVNDIIRGEVNGGGESDKTIAPGTYYLLESGSESILSALDGATAFNGSLPDSSITYDRDAGNDCAAILLETGGDTVIMKFDHANTTFDPAILGLAAVTYNFSSSLASIKSPSALWVSSQPLPGSFDDTIESDTVEQITPDGQHNVFAQSAARTMRSLDLAFIATSRVRDLATVAKSAWAPSTYAAFWDGFVRLGTLLHVSAATVSSGTTLTDPAYSTDNLYRATGDSLTSFAPVPATRTATHWRWVLRLRRLVT